MATFITSDTHFGHKNIIKYCSRPFASTDEMDEAIVTRWNGVVGCDDEVWHLGDFAFHNAKASNEYLRRLNGHKHLVLGNHDKGYRYEQGKLWESVQQYRELYVGSQLIVLFHYAMRVWNHSHHGAWHLYGHSHGSLPDDPHTLSFDIGMDSWNYTPVSFEQVAKKMATKQYIPIDAHGDPTRESSRV